MDHRMRIFEDEIIKRIKIIQSFVKTMDGKVNRLRAGQQRTTTQESAVKKSTSRLAGGHSMMEDADDRRPERLRDILDNQAPLGANQQQIKEAVKWEIEIHERKNEERFKEIEALIKKIGVKIDKQTASIVQDTTSEFQNLKAQFEEFGNTIYDRLQAEFQDKLTLELTKSL